MENIEKLLEHLKSKGVEQSIIDELAEILIKSKANPEVIKELLINDRYEKVLKTVETVIQSEGLKQVINAFAEKNKVASEIVATKEIETQKINLSNADGLRKYLQYKYWQDILMVGVILGAIILLSLCADKLDPHSVGTLVGAIIGYALGRLKGNPNN